MSAIEAPGAAGRTPGTPRARRKWVAHGLSNRIVYGGLHYGARWLPLFVLKTISTVGNSIAVTVLRSTRRGMAENFERARIASNGDADRYARRVFFEYGRATIDVWRLRSEAFTGQKLENQLAEAALECATRARCLSIDREADTIAVSSVFSWREKEFTAKYADAAPPVFASRSPIERAVVALLQPKLLTLEREVLSKNTFRLSYIPFDWTLNDLTGRGGR